MRVALGVVLPGANSLTVSVAVVGHVEVAALVEGQGVGADLSPVRVALGVVLPGANLLTVLLPLVGHVEVAALVEGQGVGLGSAR